MLGKLRLTSGGHVSVNSKSDHPSNLPPSPGKLPESFMKGGIPHSQSTTKVRNNDNWVRKIVQKRHPRDNYFQKSSKNNTKHETEVMKANTTLRKLLFHEEN